MQLPQISVHLLAMPRLGTGNPDDSAVGYDVTILHSFKEYTVFYTLASIGHTSETNVRL